MLQPWPATKPISSPSRMLVTHVYTMYHIVFHCFISSLTVANQPDFAFDVYVYVLNWM